ncbi:MAG: hypothetical protein BWY85_02136 [Firmicutes bacterium ADurb.Bin506]|nr:MAG: hypothetical protein BWY85_02136 [Firmicutes bacterium ADurb.Bin506]
MTSTIRLASVAGVFKYLSLAGVLKKRSLISTFVPKSAGSGRAGLIAGPSPVTSVPSSAPRSRVISLTLLTDATDGSASPRKPMVDMESSCSALLSLLVA